MANPPNNQFWDDEEQQLAEILYAELTGTATQGAQDAMDALENEGAPEVPWNDVVSAIHDWANTYVFDTAKAITMTSKEFVEKIVQQWNQENQDPAGLLDSLEPMFGDNRAEQIAATETTKAYAEGNQETWSKSDSVTGMTWTTAEDELVCDICEPLDGTVLDVNASEDDMPPAHVSCRCYLQPVMADAAGED